MKPNKVRISLQNAYAYVLFGSLTIDCGSLGKPLFAQDFLPVQSTARQNLEFRACFRP